MQTKSTIQLITEMLTLKRKFFDSLDEVVKNYDVEDNIFCCGTNGVCEEPKTGYFGQTKECSNIDEIFTDFNILTQGIRVRGDKFFVGNLYKDLSKVNESIVVDLTNMRLIQNA